MKHHDEIRAQCIARMRQLKLNPNRVAAALPHLTRSAVCAFLAGQQSIRSDSLSEILRVLDLTIEPDSQ